MTLDYRHRTILAAVALVLACAASFGERHLLASLSAAPSMASAAIWSLIAGLLLGGLVSDRVGPRTAVLAAIACLAVGALLSEYAPLWFDLLIFGGGIALAVSNGLVAYEASNTAGRWLNFTHAFYRGGTLAFGLLLSQPGWAIWLSLIFAALSLALLPEGRPERALSETHYAEADAPWFVTGTLFLIFLAGATEIWAARLIATTLKASYPSIGLILACAMFFGRLAASTTFFSGWRQLLICSIGAAAGLALFGLVSGTPQLFVAIGIAFLSASLFPGLLGLLALRSTGGLATLLAIGQGTTMLAAPMVSSASSHAIWPAVLLALALSCTGVAKRWSNRDEK